LTIFVISLLTAGFLEIRQANMTDFKRFDRRTRTER
jgi:hypothetical protein